MKTLITICFFLSTIFLCKAQTNNALSAMDSKINDKIKELKRDKIDTIIYYYVDCVGSVKGRRPDTCSAFDIKYLLWSSVGKHYIQRFDECKEYNPASTESLLFSLLRSDYLKIRNEKIKYPEYKKRVNGKLGIYNSVVDHSCHNIFEIHTNNEILKKDIDDYALETKYDEEKNLNRNFYSNRKSILNKLKIVVEHDVDVYNKNH